MLRDLFKSNGLKRTIASVLAIAVAAVDYVPELAPYRELLIQLAGIMGALGVSHAAVSKK